MRRVPSGFCRLALLLSGLALAGPAAHAGTVLTVPRLDWAPIAEVTRANLGRSSFLPTDPTTADRLAELQKLKSGQITTQTLENNTAARQLGLASGQVARSVEQLPANVPLVLGRYAPLNATLVIDLYKVERHGAKTGVYHAAFTPAHGQYWAAAKTYLDATSKSLGAGYGPNPFARFDSVTGGSPVFLGIGMDGAEVAIGHAMRLAGAPIGILVVATPTLQQAVLTQGDVINPVTYVTTTPRLAPTWYIAAPATYQARGSSAAICAAALDPCPQEQIAPALATFEQWQGGSLPMTVDTVGTGNTVINPTTTVTAAQLASFVAGFTSSAAFEAAYASGEAGGTTTGVVSALAGYPAPAGFTATDATALPALPAERSLYAANGTLLTSPAAGTTGAVTVSNVQKAYYQAGSVSTGTLAPTAAGTDPVVQALLQGETTRVIEPTLGTSLTNGLTAVQSLYYGPGVRCAAGATGCGQGDSRTQGVLPHPDTYVETNLPNVYQDTPP